jgi:hypothetical protein
MSSIKSKSRDVIIGGSSITNSNPWPTWASWVMKRYASSNFVNTSVKGTGNEVILIKAIQEAKKYANPVVIVQLTNVDKWDWYVEDHEVTARLKFERHPITKLDPADSSGFWSTGSHFPLWKQHYKENYFSITYQMYHTLMLIHWFQLCCKANQWEHYILFDSPILSVTEQQLNLGQLTQHECVGTNLVDSALCQLLFDQIDFSNIYVPGLIGYAELHNLEWYSVNAKGHPGSLVHYYFARDIVLPWVDQRLEATEEFGTFEIEAKVMQKLFENY